MLGVVGDRLGCVERVARKSQQQTPHPRYLRGGFGVSGTRPQRLRVRGSELGESCASCMAKGPRHITITAARLRQLSHCNYYLRYHIQRPGT